MKIIVCKSDILQYENADWLAAYLFKMSLSHRCFSHILPMQNLHGLKSFRPPRTVRRLTFKVILPTLFLL